MINTLITLSLLLTCTDECGGSCSLIPGEMLGSLPLNCQLLLICPSGLSTTES